MNAPDWLAAYAEKLGAPAPTKDELNAVLDLAGVAAHASQRIAAPVATWMAGKAGVGLDEAMRLAQQVETDSPDGQSDSSGGETDSPGGESDG